MAKSILQTARDNKHGKIAFGEKSEEYLMKLSRESIEQHSNDSILYFEIDYNTSHRNFYGELLAVSFVVPQGIELNGVVKVDNPEVDNIGALANQLTDLVFSCFVEHLKEKGVDPKLNDFFSYKNKFYYIYSKTALDASKTTVRPGGEAVTIQYNCTQTQGEIIFVDPYGPKQGSQIQKQQGLNRDW